MKRCHKCNSKYNKDNFIRQSRNKDGLHHSCNQCRKKYNTDYFRSTIGLAYKIYYGQIRSSKRRGHNLPSYNKTELYKWIISQNNFNKLYSEWIDSNYNIQKIPSVDRKDDNKGYSFNNIQLITWAENKKKYDLRKNKIISRKVECFQKDGKKIKVFDTIQEAGNFYRIDYGNISRVCQGKRNTAGGLKWKYK